MPPEFIRPQTGRPDTFKAWVNDLRGGNLDEYYSARLLVSDLTEFERRVWRFSDTRTGDGASVIDWQFAPDEDFPSFSIQKLYVFCQTGAAAAGTGFNLRVSTGGPLATTNMARVNCMPNFAAPLVMNSAGIQSDQTGVDNGIRIWTSGPINIYRQRFVRGIVDDSFRVTSESTSVLNISYQIFGELIEIPRSASMADVSNQLTATP